MAAFWSREAYKLRRWELRHERRQAHARRFADGYTGENARFDVARCDRLLLLIDCGTAEKTYPNQRLVEALSRNRRLVAERLHRERVARELPKVQAAANALGMSKFDTALAELGVSWGGKSAREALA